MLNASLSGTRIGHTSGLERGTGESRCWRMRSRADISSGVAMLVSIYVCIVERGGMRVESMSGKCDIYSERKRERWFDGGGRSLRTTFVVDLEILTVGSL